MYIVPDRLELRFSRLRLGYFSLKGFTRDEQLKILCNWICHELVAQNRSWLSIREELLLDDYDVLESYFHRVTGFDPQGFADYWKNRGNR